jgi:hypothetical protein
MSAIRHRWQLLASQTADLVAAKPIEIAAHTSSWRLLAAGKGTFTEYGACIQKPVLFPDIL